MDSPQPPGNIGDTLKIIAKYEELFYNRLIALDIGNHTMYVKPEILPDKEPARSKWMKEATLYFAFKGAGDFAYEKDTLTFREKGSEKCISAVQAKEIIHDGHSEA